MSDLIPPPPPSRPPPPSQNERFGCQVRAAIHTVSCRAMPWQTYTTTQSRFTFLHLVKFSLLIQLFAISSLYKAASYVVVRRLPLRGRVFSSLFLDPPLVRDLVADEQLVGLRLCRRVGVGRVQQVLDAEEQLLDSNSWAPVLLLVEDGEADRAGGVNVGVEEGGVELALGGLGRVLLTRSEC